MTAARQFTDAELRAVLANLDAAIAGRLSDAAAVAALSAAFDVLEAGAGAAIQKFVASDLGRAIVGAYTAEARGHA